jgi:abortive infection bacteriophage resistance protein
MTKERYLEMCEVMGSEPLDSEMPVELDDFPSLVQQVFQIYHMLKDMWDPMGGNYLGKDNTSIFEFFNLYNLDKEERLLALSFLESIDACRSKIIANKKQATKPPGK